MKLLPQTSNRRNQNENIYYNQQKFERINKTRKMKNNLPLLLLSPSWTPQQTLNLFLAKHLDLLWLLNWIITLPPSDFLRSFDWDMETGVNKLDFRICKDVAIFIHWFFFSFSINLLQWKQNIIVRKSSFFLSFFSVFGWFEIQLLVIWWRWLGESGDYERCGLFCSVTDWAYVSLRTLRLANVHGGLAWVVCG